MSVLTGIYPDIASLNQIAIYINNVSEGRTKAHHIWTEELVKDPIYSNIEKARTSDVLIDLLKTSFPNSRILNVREADELYWAVSPAEAKGSDRSLVDCHYDAPFAIVETGVKFYRIIISCNENEDVNTVFPNDGVRVVMTTGDFHGLDYNRDYHCVEGSIPADKYRVLMKLHYLIVPDSKGIGSPDEMITKFLNIQWTKLSRLFMRVSAEPQNIVEQVMGEIVNVSRTVFNKV